MGCWMNEYRLMSKLCDDGGLKAPMAASTFAGRVGHLACKGREL